MDKYQQAQREANAAATAASNIYPPPPSYDQATSSSYAAASMGNAIPAPAAAAVPAPKPMPIPTQMPMPARVYVQQSGYPTQAPPIIHVQAQHQQPVVIIQQHGRPLGPESTFLSCPFCHAENMTRVEHEPNSRTHLMALLLCLFGFWCCACVPYCATSCMNANHYCKNCNKYLGAYSGSL